MSNVAFVERKRTASYLNVRANVDDVIRCAEEIGVTTKNLRAAQKRAMRKLGNWLASKTLAEVAKEKQITMKVLRQRFRVYQDSRFRDLYVKAWFGLDPLAYERLGKPRQTKKGVRVGKHSVAGAFLAAPKMMGVKPSSPGVWKREGKDRFPIYKPRLDVNDSLSAALERVFPGALARLQTLVHQEMNYEIKKATGKLG